MTPAERAKIIAQLKPIVASVREALDEIADAMWEIQEEFQFHRRALLSEAKRQSGRGQKSNLLLCVRIRNERALGAPAADWKKIQARGYRVTHAKATLAAKLHRQLSPARRAASSVNIFSDTIAKNRKFGWRDMDILRYAHQCEYQLVKATERKLRPLRKRVAELARTGTRALQALYQHQRMLCIENDREVMPSEDSTRIEVKERLSEAPTPRPFVPQLRFPDRYPKPDSPISGPRPAHAPDDALDSSVPPQLRRPV